VPSGDRFHRFTSSLYLLSNGLRTEVPRFDRKAGNLRHFVLERGLNALADKVLVSYHYADWQKIIGQVESKLKSGALPRGPELDFYRHVNAQFGFLKEAYRKHSAHARDDPYDMEKALSILNHVRSFMQELAKGGLSE